MKELLLVGFNTFEGGAKAANISENIKHLDVRVITYNKFRKFK